MLQSQEENQSFWGPLWSLIMLMIKSEEGSEWDYASLSIWLVLFGIQSDRQLWKVQLLVKNSWQ